MYLFRILKQLLVSLKCVIKNRKENSDYKNAKLNLLKILFSNNNVLCDSSKFFFQQLTLEILDILVTKFSYLDGPISI